MQICKVHSTTTKQPEENELICCLQLPIFNAFVKGHIITPIRQDLIRFLTIKWMHLILRGYLPDLLNFVIGKYLFTKCNEISRRRIVKPSREQWTYASKNIFLDWFNNQINYIPLIVLINPIKYPKLMSNVLLFGKLGPVKFLASKNSFSNGDFYCNTVGSVRSILIIKLQNGQLMFSHPHWIWKCKQTVNICWHQS